jgi:large subunit ribosomal protein L24
MQKIKKADKVIVMRGRDAGKIGEVLKVVTPVRATDALRVVVRGVNIVKKSQKPNPTAGIQGGIIEVEKPITISNVMLVDPKDGKTPTRVKFEIKDGKKVRVAVKSGTVIGK